MKNNKVSICIPTYNCGNYISETIESVLSQNFADYELLIIDNASSDNTAAVAESYARLDNRIRLKSNPYNLGMVGNWNECLKHASGEYVKFVFGDDLLASPDAVGRMVSLLDSDPSISLACSARNIIDKDSRVISVESHFETGIFKGTDVISSCLQNRGNLICVNWIGEPSVVMFRKNQAGRGFNPCYRQIVDLEMWFHLLEQGSLAYIDEPLCSFRVHDLQQTAVNKETSAHLKDFILLFDEYLHKDYVPLSAFMKQYQKYGYLYSHWKAYKNNLMSRENALELINTNRSFSFFAWYPLYKLGKPLIKLYQKAAPQPETYCLKKCESNDNR